MCTVKETRFAIRESYLGDCLTIFRVKKKKVILLWVLKLSEHVYTRTLHNIDKSRMNNYYRLCKYKTLSLQVILSLIKSGSSM